MFEIICCVSNSLYCLSSSNKQTNIIISFLLRVYRLIAYVLMINCTTLLVMGMKRECDQNKQYRLSFHHDHDFMYTSLTLLPNLFELEKGLWINESWEKAIRLIWWVSTQFVRPHEKLNNYPPLFSAPANVHALIRCSKGSFSLSSSPFGFAFLGTAIRGGKASACLFLLDGGSERKMNKIIYLSIFNVYGKRFDEEGQQGENILFRRRKISREGNVRGQEDAISLFSCCGGLMLCRLLKMIWSCFIYFLCFSRNIRRCWQQTILTSFSCLSLIASA